MNDCIKMTLLGFSVSKISAVAGRHPYQDKLDTIADEMVRYNKKYLEEIGQVGKMSIAQKVTRSLEKEIADIVKDESLKEPDFVSKRDLVEKAEASVPAHARKSAGKFVKGIEARIRGCILEDVTIKNLCEAGYDIRVDQKKCFCKTFSKFKLFGRVDGLIYGSDGEIETIVEVKNRMNKFFTPGYDLDQLAAYIAITGAKNGLLVQMCKGTIEVSEYDSLSNRFTDLCDAVNKSVDFILSEEGRCEIGKRLLL